MKQYSRARPWHWVLALFSNTRKWLRLPFIAYQSQGTILGRTFQFYWGWRPTGALGAKFRFTVLGK